MGRYGEGVSEGEVEMGRVCVRGGKGVGGNGEGVREGMSVEMGREGVWRGEKFVSRDEVCVCVCMWSVEMAIIFTCTHPNTHTHTETHPPTHITHTHTYTQIPTSSSSLDSHHSSGTFSNTIDSYHSHIVLRVVSDTILYGGTNSSSIIWVSHHRFHLYCSSRSVGHLQCTYNYVYIYI